MHRFASGRQSGHRAAASGADDDRPRHVLHPRLITAAEENLARLKAKIRPVFDNAVKQTEVAVVQMRKFIQEHDCLQARQMLGELEGALIELRSLHAASVIESIDLQELAAIKQRMVAVSEGLARLRCSVMGRDAAEPNTQ